MVLKIILTTKGTTMTSHHDEITCGSLICISLNHTRLYAYKETFLKMFPLHGSVFRNLHFAFHYGQHLSMSLLVPCMLLLQGFNLHCGKFTFCGINTFRVLIQDSTIFLFVAVFSTGGKACLGI